MKREGIAIAGNLIADIIKMIESYPTAGNLTSIVGNTETGIGGCCANTIADLAILDKTLKLYALGRVGDDANGAFILGVLSRLGVDVSQIITDAEHNTSYTDVMTVASDGSRTFFHARGANAYFNINDIDFDSLTAEYFHLGYALLLDSFDAPDVKYGTVMARALHEAQKRGMKTSIDVVSEEGERFGKLVPYALAYCDNVILNEVESGLVAGIAPRTADGSISIKNLKLICAELKRRGVRENVVIHCPEVGVGMDKNGEFVAVPSLDLGKNYIVGSVGAGDAFCAGSLYAFTKHADMKTVLTIGSQAAAASLGAKDSYSGMKSAAQLAEFETRFGRKKLN